MCTVENEQSVVVCDVAIGRVRQELAQRIPSGITYTTVEGKGTRVQADAGVDGQQFSTVVQQAIAQAQNRPQD